MAYGSPTFIDQSTPDAGKSKKGKNPVIGSVNYNPGSEFTSPLSPVAGATGVGPMPSHAPTGATPLDQSGLLAMGNAQGMQTSPNPSVAPPPGMVGGGQQVPQNPLLGGVALAGNPAGVTPSSNDPMQLQYQSITPAGDQYILNSFSDAKNDMEEAQRLRSMMDDPQHDENPMLPAFGQLFMQKQTLKSVASMFRGMDPRMVAGFAAALAASFTNPNAGMMWAQGQQQMQQQERGRGEDRQARQEMQREQIRARQQQDVDKADERTKTRMFGLWQKAAQMGAIDETTPIPRNDREAQGLASAMQKRIRVLDEQKQNKIKADVGYRDEMLKIARARLGLSERKLNEGKRTKGENLQRAALMAQVQQAMRQENDVFTEITNTTGMDWINRGPELSRRYDDAKANVQDLLKQLGNFEAVYGEGEEGSAGSTGEGGGGGKSLMDLYTGSEGKPQAQVSPEAPDELSSALNNNPELAARVKEVMSELPHGTELRLPPKGAKAVPTPTPTPAPTPTPSPDEDIVFETRKP